MKEFYDHIQSNLETFNFWIEKQERLQVSNDIFKPLIPVFMAENPTVNLNGCQDCIIDMLIWCRMKLKQQVIEPTFNEKLDQTTEKIITKNKKK